MAKKQVKGLERKEWFSNFVLVGKANVGDKTFGLDLESEKSDWVYNRMNLGIDCGEKSGLCFCEMMGGFGSERDNVIKVYGKDEEGKDDFNTQIEVDWEDRFDEDIIKDTAKISLITVGLEKTTDNKTYYKNFLSAYDAIAYINEHLKQDMIVRVTGNLKYEYYNGNVYVKKIVNSIVLSSKEEEDFEATFRQSILLTKDSIGVDDKTKSVFLVNAKVLEYFKSINGYEVTGKKKFIPIPKTFEYAVNFEKPETVEKVKQMLFNVRRDVTQITFNGKFIESGATVATTIDDLDDDIKDMIEAGIYSLEEALEDASQNGGVDRRMILTKPLLNKADSEKKTKATIKKIDKMYTEQEMYYPCFNISEEDEENTDDEVEDTNKTDDDDMDWLKDIE